MTVLVLDGHLKPEQLRIIFALEYRIHFLI